MSLLPEENIIEIQNTLDDWPKPMPLPDAHPSVLAFDLDLLPDVIRPWIEDISERLQCPPDYPAVGVMVGLSSVIGRQLAIRPKQYDDWTVIPNLWGGVIGPPGVMKTPALMEALRPLRRLEAEAADGYRTELKSHELDVLASKSRMKALKSELDKAAKSNGKRDESEILEDIRKQNNLCDSPVCKRYETNDSTVEKLGELLQQNPNGILTFRDELVGWLRTLDKPGHEGARAFYLESWDGKSSFTYDRIGRGTIRIEAACVSVLGGIQPGPLANYIREANRTGAGADGLLQRFQLLIQPDQLSVWKNIDRWPDTEARIGAFNCFQRLADMQIAGTEIDENNGIPYLQFDDAAQEIFTEWRINLERYKLRSDEPEIIESHLSKYRSLIPSMALICHLVDGGEGAVSEQAILRATAWGKYLEAHARRIYSICLGDGVSTRSLGERILKGDVQPSFKPKTVYDKHWRHLDREGTLRAIDSLESLDWLRVIELQTGGRPSTICEVNPRVYA